MKKSNKYFSPSNVEWSNSAYFYNKNSLKLFPALDKVILRIIRSYLNMYDTKAEKSVRLNRLTKRKRWLSSARKSWISKLNLKHTNDKVIINVFTYDRINNEILIKFKKFLNSSYTKRLKNINSIKNTNLILNNKLLNNINTTYNNNINNKLNNSIKILINSLKIKFMKKILKREINILYYKRFISLNTLKYKDKFIWIMQKLIGKIYNKKIIFNIVSLKNFYLNSNILTQILVHKSKNRNLKANRVMADALSLVEIPTIKKSMISKVSKNKFSQKITLKGSTDSITGDNLNIVLKDYYNTLSSSTENEVLNSLKNKSIIGVRLQAVGRLTKRFTAQRSVKIIKHIGTLKNVDSSFRGIPVEMLRSSKKNNIQFSKANSQNRIGSFGIRGWINSI